MWTPKAAKALAKTPLMNAYGASGPASYSENLSASAIVSHGHESAQTGNPSIDRFLAYCHRRRYPAKTVVIHEGDKPTVLYYLLEGSVTVIRENENGQDIVLAYLNPGDFFGEMGLFDNCSPRSAWVRTRTACLLAEISYDKFRHVAKNDAEILFALSAQMATRLRNTSRKVSDLACLDVTGRIARALLSLCQEPDAMTHPEGMQICITRQELGRIVGCSREMAGKVLKELEQQHLITAKGKTIVVIGARR